MRSPARWPSTSARSSRRRSCPWRAATAASRSATSARSAARRPSSTRKGARSASRAASTSAESRRGASPPFRSLPPGGLRRQSRRSNAADHEPDVKSAVFSGGTYDEVARWLWNFLTSHAKREDPRIEVSVESGDDREGVSYGARLRFGHRETPVIEFEYPDVAANRGTLAWGKALAQRTRQI